MRHIALERFGDGGFEFGGTVALQEAHQGGGDGAEIVAALGGAHEQDLARRRGLSEVVGGPMTASSALLAYQLVDMRGILDLCALVVAAPMAGEDLLAVDDAHFVNIGEEGEWAADMSMRDRIVIEIEADIGPLASADGQALE